LAVTPYTPSYGTDRPSLDAGDWSRDAVQALIVALPERVRELAARLAQTSANASRPPSSDPRQAPPRPKAPLSGRQRGGRKALDRTLMPGI